MLFSLGRSALFSLQHKYKSLSISLSALLLLCSFFVIVGPLKKVNWGIDFTGGISLELHIDQSGQKLYPDDFKRVLQSNSIDNVSIDKLYNTNGTSYLISSKLDGSGVSGGDLINNIKQVLSKEFSGISYLQASYVGPQISSDIVKSGIMAIAFAVVGIMTYLYFRFDLYFAVGGTLALIHDTALTMGMISMANIEFNFDLIAAILTIIGYSINDTVIIYDRIRENLKSHFKYDSCNEQTKLESGNNVASGEQSQRKMAIQKDDFAEIIDRSIRSTLRRTMLTSGTTAVSLLVLIFFGGSAIAHFGYVVLFGVLIGTYSSICIAPSLSAIGRKYKGDCIKNLSTERGAVW